MNNLTIEKEQRADGRASSTPYIHLDAAGRGVIVGDSYPENAVDFYKPVFSWLHDYFASTDRPFTLELMINYMNTSTTKTMYDLLELFSAQYNACKEATLVWYIDPDDPDDEDARYDAELKSYIVEQSLNENAFSFVFRD